ncbi:MULTISPECIES: hypothetical protein [Streptomyces]|jgi:hypothetical protein|uniref:hypothetical protein n=1 Tax=Streptomyces TaxID=1883 RepID=UPI000AF59F7F|nr:MULTISPECIES: hypothetical protein [Streptomyces]MDX3679479.1 hypothetical protein [Streptomyces scabiei]
MTTRPRCPQGHFLAASGICRCQLPRPRRGADLWGQGLTARKRYGITDVPLTGRYL